MEKNNKVLFKIFGFTLFLKISLVVRSYSSQYATVSANLLLSLNFREVVSKEKKKKKNTEVRKRVTYSIIY